MNWFKQSKVKSPAYLKWVASLPCLVNRVWDETVVAHHTRDEFKGMATKACDSSTVPLSHHRHAEVHMVGSDDKYFGNLGIDYKFIRKELYRIYTENATDRDEKARQLILRRKIDE